MRKDIKIIQDYSNETKAATWICLDLEEAIGLFHHLTLQSVTTMPSIAIKIIKIGPNHYISKVRIARNALV